MRRYDNVIMAGTGNRRSSTFYRLEKQRDGYVAVCEFHTVVNGNKYYIEHEENESGSGWQGEARYINTVEYGNKVYKRYKDRGYKFAGVYEMDIFGYKKLLSEKPVR